jgi:hypothetical protein
MLSIIQNEKIVLNCFFTGVWLLTGIWMPIEVQIPKEQRLIFFVVLAQHIQRKHLEVKEQQLQPPVTCIANQNIMVEKRTRTLNVSIATEKDTGLTNAHERHPDSHQQPNTSKEAPLLPSASSEYVAPGLRKRSDVALSESGLL